MPENKAAADELYTFLIADLYETYLRDPIEADLDAGTVFAEPADDGLFRIWVVENDVNGMPTDKVLAERWIALLADPTAIDRGPEN